MGNDSFCRFFNKYIKDHNLTLAVILEPKISGIKMDGVIIIMGFEFSHRIELMGFRGGIWLTWSNKLLVDMLVNSW